MTCHEFDRWLEEGMSDAASRSGASALAHVRACARCAAELEAARAVEHALTVGEPTVRAPGRLALDVMSRVRTIEAANARESGASTAPRWWTLLLDPVAIVPLTVALLGLAILIWNPAGTLQIGGWLGAHWFTFVTSAGGASLDTRIGAALLATACPFLIWGLWTIGRSLERTLVLHVVRPER